MIVAKDGGIPMQTIFPKLLTLASIAIVFASAARSQNTAKLKVSVYPEEAYTFVDGIAMGPGDRTIKLPYGQHKVLVANYGFQFFQKDITIDSPKPTVLKVSLDPSGAEVSGPRGRIQIELGSMSLRDPGRQAVLLNGRTANYFVGHVDEFNHNIHWHQELIVPPGDHQITVVRGDHVVWSGTVAVEANKRVIINILNGKQKTKDWPRGNELGSLHRFRAATASTTVAVAPVSSEISANPPKIDCGQTSQLKWTSADTIDADISGMSPVPVVGERAVSPRQSTTYDFTATGPGGVTKSRTTIDVNPTVQSTLSASTMEVRYRQIGDKTVQSDTTTLNWSTSNADAVSLTPFGTVEVNGNKSVTPKPTQTSEGRVDETVQYALAATNGCGGSDTKTVAVHVTGSIEPIPGVFLQSVFFPTDYPTKHNPSDGLLRSQQETLTTLATGFTKYLEYDPDAKLSLAAYADERGTDGHNQDLSELRAQRVRDFLVSQGVDASKISTSAYGLSQPLDKSTVTDLQTRNPNEATVNRARNFRSTWLAYNRRVDVVLKPANRESIRFYPNSATDSELLWQRSKPELKKVRQEQ
jgi:outer membrane protein OmpA-like peptidoglycan-associated protein